MTSYAKHVPMHAFKTKKMDGIGFSCINLQDNDGKIYDSKISHRHLFFELLFFDKASGKHEIDFKQHLIENNSVHFVSPGQIHKLQLKKKKGFVLCFTEDFVSVKTKGSFYSRFPDFDSLNSPTFKLDKATSEEINKLIGLLHAEYQAQNIGYEDICRSFLNIILLKINFALHKSIEGKQHALIGKKNKVRDFKKLVNDNYLLNKSLVDYSRELFISPNHLNALCKQQEGKTATAIIQERIVLEAKRLLLATDLNVKEISFYLQFEDVPYFNRFFKKHTQLTPISYRKGVHKNR